MNIGITGHQDRPGIDWAWVHDAIATELSSFKKPIVGLSSLAKGADQIFAQAVLESGGKLIAVIPIADYERYFEGEFLDLFLFLKNSATVVELNKTKNVQGAFLQAGRYVADNCELLIAVWDGKPAAGKGGTADIVEYATKAGKIVIHIDPISRRIRRL